MGGCSFLGGGLDWVPCPKEQGKAA